MIYKNWLEEWLAHYIEPTAKTRTYSRYSEIVSLHIIPKLGGIRFRRNIPRCSAKVCNGITASRQFTNG